MSFINRHVTISTIKLWTISNTPKSSLLPLCSKYLRPALPYLTQVLALFLFFLFC